MNMFTPAEVTANYSAAGKMKTELSVSRMLVLGVLAGMCIAFAGAAANTAVFAVKNPGLAKLISGLVFPFGLAMVVLTGAELFTGNCLIPISVLDGEARLGGMLKNWLFVYLGNFAGSLLVASACAFSGQLGCGDGALAAYAIKVAAAKCGLGFGRAVILGVCCNVLVTIAVLQAMTARDTAGKIAGTYLPICLFVVCGFEHSVADMFYVPAGLFALSQQGYAQKAAQAGIDTSALSWGGFLSRNLLPVTVGNIIGGVFVAWIFWFAWLRGRKDRG